MSREKRAEFMRKREMKAKLAIGRFNSDKVESFSDLQEMITDQNNHQRNDSPCFKLPDDQQI